MIGSDIISLYQLLCIHRVSDFLPAILAFSLVYVIIFFRISNIIVCSSFVKYAALLPLDLSVFAIGHVLQTLPLLCKQLG